MAFVFNAKLLDYKSPKWRIIHNLAKPLLEGVVTAVYKECEDILRGKAEKGWQNPEIELLYNLWGEVLDRDISMRKGTEEWDHIRDVMGKLRAIVCVQLDEDSHFTLRAFYLIDSIIMNADKFNIEFHKKRAYWDEGSWRAMVKKITEGSEEWQEYLARQSAQLSGPSPTAKPAAAG